MAAGIAAPSRCVPQTQQLSEGVVSYVHICHAQDDASLDPIRFIEKLATRLAAAVPGFSESLLASTHAGLSVVGAATAGKADTGSTVAGVIIKSLQIPNLSSRMAFDRLVRRPLQGSSETPAPVILIDGLDEALVYGDDENLVELVASVSRATGSRAALRFLLTSRTDDRVLKRIHHCGLDLTRDAPTDVNDVRDYAVKRLARFPSVAAAVAAKIADAANGNFLYARYVVDTLVSEPARLAAPEKLTLPNGLEGHYEEYIQRELTRREERWEERYRPLLGLLSVALGSGLMCDHLAGAARLAGSRVDDTLTALSQYLTKASPNGPFQLFHQSFREFLTSNTKFPLYPAESHAALGMYLHNRNAGRWPACGDDYALLHTLEHLSHASRHGDALDPEALDKVVVARNRLIDDDSYHECNRQEGWIADQVVRHTGRIDILSRVDGWLASPGEPILLIVGPAGVGKTMIAAKIVHLTRHCQGDPRFPTLSSGVISTLLRLRIDRREPSQVPDQLTAFLLARLRAAPDPSEDHQPAEDLGSTERAGEIAELISTGVKAGPVMAEVGPDAQWERVNRLLWRLRSMENRGPLLVVLDGLDEATNGMAELPSRLTDIAQSGPVRLIVTSRLVPELEAFLQRMATTLTMDNLPIDEVAVYLRSFGIPEDDAEKLSGRSQGSPLMARFLAEDYRRTGVIPEARNLADEISRYIDRQIEKAGDDGQVAKQFLAALARHSGGLSATELATSATVPVSLAQRVLKDLGPLLTKQANGRYHLYHQAVVEVILSRDAKDR